MNQDLDVLREAKDMSGAEISSLIRDLTPHYLGQIRALRDILDRGTIFKMERGDTYDIAVVQTALLSLVLTSVTLNDPHSKDRQIQNIRDACGTLGLSFDEVLDLTTQEHKIKAALA